MNPKVIVPSKKPLIGIAALEAVVMAVWAYVYFTMIPPASRNVLYLVAPVMIFSLIMSLTAMRLNLTRLTIAPPQLNFESGLLNKTQRSFNLTKIQDVRVEQSITERIFGIGTIHIETASAGGGVRVESIDSPRQVADHILAAARQS
ncbi:MAG: PH domain-containing protein [Bryobacteraceae bacterium]|nr:PH domain-containing protein [Bryobacteraceae bacterium]